jgi:hypothetical protein
MTNETYYVSYDRQGGTFGMYRNYTIQEWREQAIEWAETDEDDELITHLATLPDEEIIETISNWWELDFEKGCWQGTPINNEHGIEMYYEIDTFVDKLNILDSNGKYFDDLLLDHYTPEECDIQAIVNTLRHTTLAELVNFFAMKKIYNSLDELTYDLQDPEITEDNYYINIFKVNDKKYYVWSD